MKNRVETLFLKNMLLKKTIENTGGNNSLPVFYFCKIAFSPFLDTSATHDKALLRCSLLWLIWRLMRSSLKNTASFTEWKIMKRMGVSRARKPKYSSIIKVYNIHTTLFLINYLCFCPHIAITFPMFLQFFSYRI